MRTTVELEDGLFRRVKVEAALRGCKLKELVEEGLLLVLASSQTRGVGVDPRPNLGALTKEYCGIVDTGMSDLATDPKHLEGFGRDPVGNR